MTITTSRRAMLTAAASFPALAIPVMATSSPGVDPIFAAIERDTGEFEVELFTIDKTLTEARHSWRSTGGRSC